MIQPRSISECAQSSSKAELYYPLVSIAITIMLSVGLFALTATIEAQRYMLCGITAGYLVLVLIVNELYCEQESRELFLSAQTIEPK